MFRWLLLPMTFISLLGLQDAPGQATPYLTDLYLEIDRLYAVDSSSEKQVGLLQGIAKALFDERYHVADSLLQACEQNFHDIEIFRLRNKWLLEIGRFDEVLRRDTLTTTELQRHDSIGILNLMDRASAYIGIGDYDHAFNLYQLLQENWNYPPGHLISLRFLEQRALLYTLMDHSEMAFELFAELDSLWKEKDHRWYLYFKTHQGINLTQLGKYDLAESAFLEVVSKSKKSLFRVEADAASNLAQLYYLIGDYSSAERFFLIAENYYLSKGLVRELSTLSNNLGLLYDAMDSLDLARQYYTMALGHYQEVGDTASVHYAIILQNLAGLLDYLEEYVQAEPLYLNSLRIIQMELGAESDLYTTTLSNLGILYENMELPEKSEPYYLEGLSIRKNTLGPDHPKYVELLYNLAGLYSHLKPDAAIPVYLEANRKQLELMKYYYSTFDQETSVYFYEHMELEFERFYSLVTTLDMSSDIAIDMLNFSLATKGLALEYHRMDRASVHSNLEAVNVYKEWKKLRDSLSISMLQSGAEASSSEADIEQLKFQTNLLEKEWSRSTTSPMYGAIDFEQLKSTLKKKEVFIDFISFEQFKSGEWTGNIEYYAMLVHKNSGAPEIVRLCTEEDIKDLFQSNIHPVNDPQLNRALYELVWHPIQTQVSGYNKIFVSPTRMLHKVPFDGFFDGKKYLVDNYEFRYLSLAKNIEESSSFVKADESMLIVGALDYGVDGDAKYFPYLQGTQKEIDFILDVAKESISVIDLMTGSDALEMNIREKLNTDPPSIFHIASHGFSFDGIVDKSYGQINLRNKIMTSENPLLRAGFVLSKVNQYWMSEEDSKPDNDGVLTAMEVSTLPLNDTELVVLSACETGLGEVHSIEGVFGLQRAFRMCGVDQVMYTLWVIPDTESSLLLQFFYKFYFRGRDASAALQKAKKRLSKKYPPRYWAGYVLMQ